MLTKVLRLEGSASIHRNILRWPYMYSVTHKESSVVTRYRTLSEAIVYAKLEEERLDEVLMNRLKN